ncbi:MAG TPA: hypothetical protein VK786_05700, partial [bacterium]|nr:hypothetical protein [bacterium]
MNLQGAVALFCSGSTVVIAFYILWRYSGQRLHRFFVLEIFGFVAYAVFLSGLAEAQTQFEASQWMRYAMVLPYFNIFTFYLFCMVLSRGDELKPARWLPWILGVPASVDLLGRMLSWFPLPPMQ